MINAGVRLIVPLGVGAGIAEIGGTMVTEPVSLSPFSGQSESTFIAHLAGGLVRRSGPLVTALSAGPAFVQVSPFESVSGRRQLVSRAYPGVYAGAQAITVLSQTVGVGAEAFGVLNGGQTTGGLRLFVAIGSLRQRGP